MGFINVSGSLDGANDSGSFGASQFTAPLSLSVVKKYAPRASGVLRRTVPAAYEELSAIGAGADVPLADTLYIRSESDILLRLTYQSGGESPTVVVLPVKGLFILELQSSRLLELVEVQGSGQLEYFASGP